LRGGRAKEISFPSPCRLLHACCLIIVFFKLTDIACFVITGLYQDCKNGVMDGACVPLLIHTDKSKTKEKEREERERQHSGEMIGATTTAP